MTTPYHSQYFACELTRRCSAHEAEKLNASLLNASVDLNPHQIDAALFAFNSPLSRGALMADEVGLGKTIEAGLVMSQLWVPDFIVETDGNKFIVEIKGMRDLIPAINEAVKEKAVAAVKWTEHASKIEGNKTWEYKLVPEDAIGAGREFGFVVSHSVRIL